MLVVVAVEGCCTCSAVVLAAVAVATLVVNNILLVACLLFCGTASEFNASARLATQLVELPPIDI